ncbi:uncharacterized protein LOC130813525 [Amaranthus tricolor]|uniref:uncharacterized protein LOC130813525 n=1 Tax=Amaranthus tricolor TaxID=29722 RepID=UPI00258A3BB8|nr:uncharacterized protein LOC130813525 [Amaranthus tricolor]
MAGNQGKGKGFFRGLLSGNRSRPTLLRGDPHERGVTGSARRARQEQAAIHSQAQRSSTLEQVRSRFERQSSLHSHTVGSGDDDTDYDESLSREESLGQDESACHPIDWTIVRGHAVKFKIRGQGSSGTSDQAGVSQAEDAAPRGRRRSQSADTDWLITSAQPGGPLGLAGLFGMPLSELRAKGHFTSGSINVGALLQLCHRSQSMDTQCTAYYMAIAVSYSKTTVAFEHWTFIPTDS